MRFANIASSLITISLLSTVLPPKLLAQDTWQLGGQPAIVFSDPERSRQVQSRWEQILPSLDPRTPWTVDVFIPPTPSPSARPTPPPQLVIVRLQGQPLIEVRPADVTFARASNVIELANQWASRLNSLFSQANLRYTLVISRSMPSQLIYQGRVYTLRPQLAPDRGLFRTNGRRVDDRVIFWEIPADSRAYVVSENLPTEPNQPEMIYLLHPRRFFVPYQRN